MCIAARTVLMVWVCLWAGVSLASSDTALVTSTRGKVVRIDSGGRSLPIDAFVKIGRGEVLKLEAGAAVKLLYFESGRQEYWGGTGELEVGDSQGKGSGLPAPEVSLLSALQVRQIAKTPAPDSKGRPPAIRTRAIATPEAINLLESEYDRMRVALGGNDLNAEIFLLSGLFEMRELERVEVVLGDLELRQKHNNEAKLLISLYRKALSGARRSK